MKFNNTLQPIQRGEDYFFKPRELICDTMGYKTLGYANWYRKIKDNPKYVTEINGENYITKRGVYECLSKSDKKIAEDFRDRVYDYLEDLQKQEMRELRMYQSKYIEAEKDGFIYCFKDGDRVIYIGKTVDLNSRLSSHRENILKGRSFLPVYHYISYYGLVNMTFEQVHTFKFVREEELRDMELMYINHFKTPFNKESPLFLTCEKCQKSYKIIQCFITHEC